VKESAIRRMRRYFGKRPLNTLQASPRAVNDARKIMARDVVLLPDASLLHHTPAPARHFGEIDGTADNIAAGRSLAHALHKGPPSL
jgi:hypothetical protein